MERIDRLLASFFSIRIADFGKIKTGFFTIVIALIVGFLTSQLSNIVLAAVVGASIVILILFGIIRYEYRVFWLYLSFILLGYLTFGKGFAYIGRAPVYISEIGLGLLAISGMILLLQKKIFVERIFNFAFYVLLIFVSSQLLQTLPYLTVYGVDTLRDAMLWGYALYALFIYLFVPKSTVRKFIHWYGRCLPFILVWLLVALLLTRIWDFNIKIPGMPIPLIWLKSGDVGVHLAGIGGFMLLRLDRYLKRWPDYLLWLFWILWGISWLGFGITNRGGALSALVGISVVVFWNAKTRWDRPLLLAIFALVLLYTTDFSVNYGSEQDISFKQIAANFGSILGESKNTVLEATKQYRLNWWTKILNYTLYGDYFWTGRGYGISLAGDIGLDNQINNPAYARSPHNVTMTILARSGVPGVLLWLFFLLVIGWMFVKILLQKACLMKPYDFEYALWLLAYWSAFILNAHVDVFLEGPMGGIWFWSITGVSMSLFADSRLYRESGIQKR